MSHRYTTFAICAALAALLLAPPAASARKLTETAVVSDELSSSHSEESSGEDRRRRKRDAYRSCKQRLRQLVHYDDLALRAKDQGKKQWEASNRLQINNLEATLEQRCPQQYAQRKQSKGAVAFYRKLREGVKLAMEAAKAYFTGGLY